MLSFLSDTRFKLPTYELLVLPTTLLCLGCLIVTSTLDRDLFQGGLSQLSGFAGMSASNNGHAESSFHAQMQTNKRDFLEAVKAKERLDDWVIVMGEHCARVCRLVMRKRANGGISSPQVTSLAVRYWQFYTTDKI